MYKTKIDRPLKAQTRKEIAAYLGVSSTTLWRKLKKEKLHIPSGLIYPSDLKKIYALFFDERQ